VALFGLWLLLAGVRRTSLYRFKTHRMVLELGFHDFG
jgi:hypothetical protein